MTLAKRSQVEDKDGKIKRDNKPEFRGFFNLRLFEGIIFTCLINMSAFCTIQDFYHFLMKGINATESYSLIDLKVHDKYLFSLDIISCSNFGVEFSDVIDSMFLLIGCLSSIDLRGSSTYCGESQLAISTEIIWK